MASRSVQKTFIIQVKGQGSFRSLAAELGSVRTPRHRTVSVKDSCKNTCNKSRGIGPTVAGVERSGTYTITH